MAEKLSLETLIKGSILLVNKPLGWTSFDVVNKLNWVIKKQSHQKIKVGHAGTLDPLATGLLIICTGSKTKEIQSLMGLDKRYTGSFFIGATTPCFDLEMEPDLFFETAHITETLIRETAQKMGGKQAQIPPQFSAKKVDGKRAYESARKGEVVEIKPKEIEIKSFEITEIAMPVVSFDVLVSTGTYIRAMARDLGVKLQSGAYLKSLTRTSIGPFELKEAYELDALVEEIKGM